MLGNLTGWHALILLAVVLLVFGAAKLPALAKSVGQSVHILKKEVKTSKGETSAEEVAADPVAQTTDIAGEPAQLHTAER